MVTRSDISGSSEFGEMVATPSELLILKLMTSAPGVALAS